MQIYSSLNDLPLQENLSVTIGNFDGVHLGHLALLEHTVSQSHHHLVVTFENHPASFFTQAPYPELISLETKLFLLEKAGVDSVVVLAFDEKFAQTTYEEFLCFLYDKGMRHLTLGTGASLGYRKQGTEDKITELGKKVGFTTHFIEKTTLDKEIISSSSIKQALDQGNIDKASQMLGWSWTESFF